MEIWHGVPVLDGSLENLIFIMLEVTCLYSLTALGESGLTKLILKSLNAYDRNKSAYGKV